MNGIKCLFHTFCIGQGVIRINTSNYNNSYYNSGFIDGQQNIYDDLNISYTYHKHKDADGNEQSVEYQASVSGGCFTKENIIYTTTTGPCGQQLYNAGATSIYNDVTGEWLTAYNFNCPIHGHQRTEGGGWSGNCTVQCTKEVDTGKRYYTINCGKTEDSIESATITY